MRKSCYLLITAIILLSVQSCRNSERKVSSIINNPESSPISNDEDSPDNNIFTIDYRNIKDTVSLQITEILDDIKFIKLETREESLMKIGGLTGFTMESGTIWIGEKYILVLDRSMGILQFTSEGNFVRTLVSPGRGPCEFGYPVYTVVETGSGTLYIADPTHPKSIMRYNLTTGECLSTIPRALDGFVKSLLVADDSTILITPLPTSGAAGKYFIFSQTFNGRLIWGIKNAGLNLTTDYRMDELSRIRDSIYFQPIHYDTVFIYDNQKLKPTMIIKSRNKPSPETNYISEGNIKVSIETNTPFYAIISAQQIQEVRGNNSGGLNIKSTGIHSVFVDKLNKRAYKISGTKDEMLNWQFHPGKYRSSSKGDIFYTFTATEFRYMAARIAENADFVIDSSIKDQIIQLGKIHTSSDNPVIMIGKPKPFRD